MTKFRRRVIAWAYVSACHFVYGGADALRAKRVFWLTMIELALWGLIGLLLGLVFILEHIK